ncbi:uncharacterized protein LOC123794287 isoform X1 [Ursus americanus]|uniref:uncharacterized protein LOC123794287 isoform X1 n=1 Tax=Ursus americanus TaxID=9643 RepID=UPI001E679FA1|nr:uncharacterized protein LOC123794287 isoform X1 [Ursus americanus]
MGGRSPKVRPSLSPSALRGPLGGRVSLPRSLAGRAGTSVPEARSPPGAWPFCPAGRRGPNRVHPGRPSCPDRYPGVRCAGCRGRPAGLSGRDLGIPGRLRGQAVNLSAPCPSNHLQAQVTAETPEKCGRAPPSLLQPRLHAPDPGEPTSRARHVQPRGPRFPATPRPSTRRPAQLSCWSWQWRGHRQGNGEAHCTCLSLD